MNLTKKSKQMKPKQLTLFDVPKARCSHGQFCDTETLKRENEFRKSIKYIHSVTDFQPMYIRQLLERIVELELQVKLLKGN